VWDKLRKQIAVEREQLHELIGIHRPLLEKCAASDPNALELSAPRRATSTASRRIGTLSP